MQGLGTQRMKVFWEKQQSQVVWVQEQQDAEFILEHVEFEATEGHLKRDVKSYQVTFNIVWLKKHILAHMIEKALGSAFRHDWIQGFMEDVRAPILFIS